MSASIEALAQTLGLHRAGRDYRGQCPACGYATSLVLSLGRNGRILHWCASCQDSPATWAAIRAAGAGEDYVLDHQAAHDDKAARNALKQACALVMWNGSEPAAGTIADLYLTGRGLAGLAASPALRFRADTPHPTGGRRPALVACVKDSSGAIVAVHRTYLRPDGAGKADVEPAKASLGPITGAAVWLNPPGHSIVVGEGIESSASAGRLLGLPACSAISAGNLSTGLALPDCVTSVIIAADPDMPGMNAATNAAARWQAGGRTVRIATPDECKFDFNDILMRGVALERI